MTAQVVRSACGFCQAGCGVLIHTTGDRILSVEGDPGCPINRGILCIKGLASLEYLLHPDRLQYPLQRVGERGSGEWQRITWDRALEMIATAFIKARSGYGSESIAFIRGSFKGGYQGTYLARFANAFGSPNIASMASVCYVPRVKAAY